MYQLIAQLPLSAQTSGTHRL